MQEYETLAQTNLHLALRKMIDLYFNVAYDDCFCHEVYDGIELWLQENADHQLVTYIQERYERGAKGYEKLMKVIEAGMKPK